MYKILKNGKKIDSKVPGIYGGYKVDKIFGTLTCKSGMRMKKENRVFFHSLEDAVKDGYRPCKNCKPIGEADFQKIKHLIPEKTLEEFYNRPVRGKGRIKKFESFVNDLDPYGEERWENEWLYDVESISHADIPAELDKKVLKDVLEYTLKSLLFDEDTPNSKFQKNEYDENMDVYHDNEDVIWQYNKIKELKEKTGKNTKIEIGNMTLILNCVIKSEFPDFEEDDIKDWVTSEGLGELLNAYLINEMEYTVDSGKKSDHYNLIHDILKQIRNNNRVKVSWSGDK